MPRWRPANHWVGGFLVVMALALGGMWIFYSLRYAISGTAPQESLLVSPVASMHLAYVLDLALLVPAYALAGVLLWCRRAWGFVLATVLVASSVLH